MQVFDVVPERLDVLVDDVRRDGADLDEAVVLDEDGVARQVAVHDGRLNLVVEVGQRGQDLRAPAPPRLKLNLAVVLLSATEELLQRARGHELRDEDQL